MNWIKPLTTVEFVFIGVFLVLYLFFFIRTYLVARKLGTTARSIIIKFFLRAAYLGLLIIGLLGPNFGVNEIEAQASGKDIFIAFDVSKSMDATDVEPSRLEKVKFEFIDKINQFRSDRIGLIFFSNEAFVHSPLTFDKEALRMYINKLNTNLIREGGTNLNSVFELAIEKNSLNLASKRKPKAIIVVTDGEDFGEIDNNLLFKLKNTKVNLIFLGVGSVGGGKIPVGSDFKKDENGKEVISKLNIGFLKEISSKNNGKLFQLNNQVNQINDLIKSLDKIEGNWIDTRKMTVANNKYYYFLLVAILLITIDILITIRTIKL